MKDVAGGKEEQVAIQSGASTWLRERGDEKLCGRIIRRSDERSSTDQVIDSTDWAYESFCNYAVREGVTEESFTDHLVNKRGDGSFIDHVDGKGFTTKAEVTR
jgi:hypothetical protein